MILAKFGMALAQPTDHLQQWPTHQWKSLFILDTSVNICVKSCGNIFDLSVERVFHIMLRDLLTQKLTLKLAKIDRFSNFFRLFSCVKRSRNKLKTVLERYSKKRVIFKNRKIQKSVIFCQFLPILATFYELKFPGQPKRSAAHHNRVTSHGQSWLFFPKSAIFHNQNILFDQKISG
jgi:hypothetical protein